MRNRKKVPRIKMEKKNGTPPATVMLLPLALRHVCSRRMSLASAGSAMANIATTSQACWRPRFPGCCCRTGGGAACCRHHPGLLAHPRRAAGRTMGTALQQALLFSTDPPASASVVPSPPYSGFPSHLPLTPAPARVGGWARWPYEKTVLYFAKI